MANVHQKHEHLTKIDQGIADCEMRVTEQILRIERMAAKGQDTAVAEECLRSLERSLKLWHAHRCVIWDALQELEGSSAWRLNVIRGSFRETMFLTSVLNR